MWIHMGHSNPKMYKTNDYKNLFILITIIIKLLAVALVNSVHLKPFFS